MGQSSRADSPRCVLAARFSAIGDVAMTIPMLYSACACNPDTKFVMVTRPSMASLFINRPPNLVVEGADLKGKYKGLWGMRRLIADMAQAHSPSTFVDLHDVLRTKAMRLFARLRGWKVAKLNKDRSNKRALTRQRNKVMLPLTSSIDRYRAALFRAGIQLEPCFSGLYGEGGKPDPAAFAQITPPKPAGEKWVGIAPFAAHPGKIYPPEKTEEVVKALSQRGDCRIFVLGGPGREAEIAEGWASRYPCVTSLCGKKYGFPAEMALMSHFDAMLTMDSANMHLAALAGTPTVSVWGATHYYCGFKGWRQSEHDMVQAPLPCRPCSVFGDKKCYRGDLLCLNGIRPDTIYRKICDKIDHRK